MILWQPRRPRFDSLKSEVIPTYQLREPFSTVHVGMGSSNIMKIIIIRAVQDLSIFSCQDGVVVGILTSGNLFVWSRKDPSFRRIKGLNNFVPKKKKIPDSDQPDSLVWTNVYKTGLIQLIVTTGILENESTMIQRIIPWLSGYVGAYCWSILKA